MFCEKAQKECPYLGDASDLFGRLTVRRATSSGREEDNTEIVGELLEKIISQDTSRCRDDYCGLVGSAVLEMILVRAKKMQQKTKGLHGR